MPVKTTKKAKKFRAGQLLEIVESNREIDGCYVRFRKYLGGGWAQVIIPSIEDIPGASVGVTYDRMGNRRKGCIVSVRVSELVPYDPYNSW